MIGRTRLPRTHSSSGIARRRDGTGYPAGKAGQAIHQFARIASVADVFDALTSDRPYRRALSTPEGYAFIISRAGRDFDPEVVDIFATLVAPHPPGTGVILSDGAGAPIAGAEIDLADSPTLTIVSTAFDPFARAHGTSGRVQ